MVKVKYAKVICDDYGCEVIFMNKRQLAKEIFGKKKSEELMGELIDRIENGKDKIK